MKKLIVLAAACSFAMAIYLPGTVSSNSSDKNPITFAKQVAPIFQKRCEECHRDGGMAPMSLATYEGSRPWARAIKEKVAGREMPPFHAAGAVGRYLNDPRLTDEEIATITKWVDGGAPKGDAKDMPAPVQWKNEWAFGEPDLVVKPKQPYTVKASKQDQYVFFVFDYVLPEDTWIRSVVTRPSNQRAVHHANTHVVTPALKAPESGYFEGDFEPSARGAIMVAGWAPGVQPVMLADGVAIQIPKGMRFGIQIHYAPAEKETVDQTQVGIYFADGLIKKRMKVMMGDRKDLSIPSNDPGYSLTSTKTFDTDATIDFFHVHMHLRGKSYVMKLTYPDGRQETALEVPRYDFNWQRTYVLKEPMRVPKGTKVDFIGTYDNSPKNKFNPDPSRTVQWGEKTTDEMMQGRIFYEAADENLNVQVKKGRAVTSTESVGK
ncbi:MAG TPA: cytochrome c [Blastocatellia bacterium]|nr:cytochrome c [Blastocatellia bacterium]